MGDPFAGFDDDDEMPFRRREPPPPQRAPPLRADLLPRGTRVKLAGLTNASLNDSIGAIAGYNEESHRYNVKLREGNEVAVRAANVLQLIEGARIDHAKSVTLGFAGSVTGTATYDKIKGLYVSSGFQPAGAVADPPPRAQSHSAPANIS